VDTAIGERKRVMAALLTVGPYSEGPDAARVMADRLRKWDLHGQRSIRAILASERVPVLAEQMRAVMRLDDLDLGVRAYLAFAWEAIPRVGELMNSAAAPRAGPAPWHWFVVKDSGVAVHLARKTSDAWIGAFCDGPWAHPVKIGAVELCTQLEAWHAKHSQRRTDNWRAFFFNIGAGRPVTRRDLRVAMARVGMKPNEFTP